MPFQTTVALNQGFGVPGDLYNDGPIKAQSYILNTTAGAGAANNVFGRGFSILSQGQANAGNTGTQVFAGFLINPKGSASPGGSGGPLTPTLTLANYQQAEILVMGSIVVTLPATANIGDIVVMNNSTGVLQTIAPGANLPVGTSPTYAVVDYFTVPSGGGLAVITVNDIPEIPVLA